MTHFLYYKKSTNSQIRINRKSNMPQIQEIDEFKSNLMRLGNEAAIRARRGERMPEITPPEAQSLEDLNALFEDDLETDSLDDTDLFGGTEDEAAFSEDDFPKDSFPDEGFSEEGFPEEGAPEDGFPEESSTEDKIPDADLSEEDGSEFDLSEFNLPEEDFEAGEADAESAVEDQDITEPAADGNFDDALEDDFGDGLEDDFNLPEGLTEDFASDLETEESAAEPVEEETFDDTFADDFGDDFGDGLEDDFSLPEGLTEDFASDLETDEPDVEEPAADSDIAEPEFEDEEALEPAAEDDFDISGFDTDIFDTEGLEAESFDVEDLEAETPEDGVVEADESLTEDTSAEDEFDLSGFDADELEEGLELDSTPPDEFGSDEIMADESEFNGLPEDFAGENLAGEDFAGEEFDASLGEEELADDFSMGELEDDDIDTSEFSLGDLGHEFGVEEESDIGSIGSIELPAEDAEDDFSDVYTDEAYAIPDDDYIELKRTLGQMPRNLKLIIEELIGDKGLTGDGLDKLINLLVKGASAKEVASSVSKITGKKIKIPAQYERRTAEDFEKEKASFGYLFKENFVPMFRTAMFVAVLLGLIMFLGFKFVYTPLYAGSLYKKGYEEIPLGNNEQANEYFDLAFSAWKKKKWFYSYAESFIDQKQYLLAEEKYQQLLSWYPEERDGVLAYAELEFKILGKYPEAEKLLNDYLFDKARDYEARLMLGDTYMDWAREIDTSKYEEARFNYAKLLEQYGGTDEVLSRMLRYFVRTDNYTEAMNRYKAFKENKKAKIEPEIYAELAGYLIDKGQLGDVREILMKARSVQEDLPELHYELARYFDVIDIPLEEAKALNAAIWLLEQTSPLTRTRNGFLIDSYDRYGMVLYEQENYLEAEEYYQRAASRYEESLKRGQIRPESKYGLIYSNLGDLSYYISGDYDQALKYFEEAEQNDYSPEILKYKKGYIYYTKEDFRNALVEFYDTADGFSIDGALMYSTANTFFNRNDYGSAEGLYTHLLDKLNKEYSTINYLLIDEMPEHRALLENMMKVSNNLGVTKYRLYERSRDPEKSAEAMVLLTDSIEYYDKLARDPDSLVAPETVNLAYLNSRNIFYPVGDFKLQIYQNIPKDLDKLNY